jgi:hypothetical protein
VPGQYLYQFIVNGDRSKMLRIIVCALIAIGALAVLGFALHMLFSPWLLLVAAGVLVWVKFRPRRSHR